MRSRRSGRRKSSHHYSDSRMRNLISYFFAFLLAVVFVIMTGLLIVRFGIFTESRFLSYCDRDYYQYTLDTLQTDAQYYTTPTGIDMSVLDDAFSVDEIAADLKGNVHAAFTGGEYTPDTTEMNRRLDNNLRAFFAANQIVPEEGSINDVIDEFTTDIDKIYAERVTLPGLASVGLLRARYMRYDKLAIAALIALMVIFIVTIIRLHHYIHRSMRYVAYGAGSAGMMCFIVPCYLYLSKFYVGFNFQPQYFYQFMVNLVVGILKALMLGGVFWFVVTAVLAFIIAMRRRQLTGR